MRFLYSMIAVLLWLWFVASWGIAKGVSADTLLISVSIVMAGGLAGGA